MKPHRTPKSDEQYEAIHRDLGKRALDALLQAADSSALTEPNWKRWNRAMIQIEVVMTQIEREMEDYHDQRTKRWRSGKSAYELTLRLQDLQVAKDAVTTWLDYPQDNSNTCNYVTLREWEGGDGPAA